jgi:hypothetical protein
LLNWSARISGGGDDVCALVEVRGPRGRRRAALLSSKESETTARCALPFVVSLIEGEPPSGVWLPEQVIDADSYLDALAGDGMRVLVAPEEAAWQDYRAPGPHRE